MLEGIDVSKYQGTVIWKDVAGAGHKFGVARCTIGRQTRDETFARNYERSLANGLVPGAYHLVTGDSTGAEQAANWKAYLDEVKFDKGLLVLDVEGWSSTLNGLEAGTLKATEYLCNWIRNTYNRQPIIYTGVYWRDNLKQHPDNFGSRLWLSYYGTNDPQGYVPKAWNTWKIWQYTSTGSVPGITGNVDLNHFKGTERELKEFAGWEWDVLATPEEIRQIVQEENAKVISRVSSEAATTRATVELNATTLKNQLNGVENRLKDAVANAGVAVDLSPVVSKLDEVAAALGELSDTNVDGDLANDIDALSQLVTKLHKHLCLPCVADDQ